MNTRVHHRAGALAAFAGALLASPSAAAQLTDLAAAQPADTSPFGDTRLEVPRRGVLMALRDLTGDRALELLRVDDKGVLARRLTEDGTYETRGSLLAWPASTVGWDLADLDGNGRTDLLLVADGKTIQRTSLLPEGGWSEPEDLFEAATYLPSGVARVPFARDIDGDGLLDLVLPGPGRFHIRLNRGAAGSSGALRWSTPIEVGYEPEIDYELGDPGRLSSTFGQSVRVPWFKMEDVDGDGQQDLVSQMGERVSFHLARPEIDALPSWQLDLGEYKTAVSASDIDLDDLLSAVSGIAKWRIEDLDGEGARDLIIGSEGTFKVYLGAGATGPVKAPDQVLKASGNVLYFFVRDVMGDARPDLQIVRGERISLGRLLKYLVVPGKLDFDVFTYQNEGGTFARRPTRRTTLALRVPRILELINESEEIADAIEAQWDIPARRVDWNADGAKNDVLDERDGVLMVFADCAPEQQKFENLSLSRGLDGLVERVVLQDLDRLDDGGESVIDLGNLDAFAVAPGKALRDATAGAKPVIAHRLWEGEDDRALRPVDLDGDGRADVISVVEGPSRTYRIQLLVRR